MRSLFQSDMLLITLTFKSEINNDYGFFEINVDYLMENDIRVVIACIASSF